jgi:hypothetical protein
MEASLLAMAEPIPLEAPVTNAVFIWILSHPEMMHLF